MTPKETKDAILANLSAFSQLKLRDAATGLLNTLGYRSNLTLELSGDGKDDFLESFDTDGRFNHEKALFNDWTEISLLFQLTADHITAQEALFTNQKLDTQNYSSYLFFAVGLKGDAYARGKLAQITREINKLTKQPALILFMHGNAVTLSVIDRRLHKREESKDVLEKVTLIKDVNVDSPHRAHIEILFDLSLPQLIRIHTPTNFDELHKAWRATLNISELNKRFYREIADWYFWAMLQVEFPKDGGANEETRNATSLIRLITRLIFVWFIKEKGIVPDVLFDINVVNKLLRFTDEKNSTYYKAILQNLFFATLNTEMGKRKFRGKAKENGGRDQHYMVHNVFRYSHYFVDPNDILRKYFDGIPFLNGGLFECLDSLEVVNGKEREIRVDGFSEHPKNPLRVPDELFFGEEQTVDLSEVYGDQRRRREKVRGIINTLSSYKFTVDENTPIEEEIALDPELLGKVFENLLAAYNPETKTTARKATGSYYTPREIVNYMVDESLIAYLETKLVGRDAVPTGRLGESTYNERLRRLLSYTEEPHQFSPGEVETLIEAIDNVKILDPACGSGAFPMGILHKLVYILGKLDPRNERWKQKQMQKVLEVQDVPLREKLIEDIEQAFQNNELDYGRKLYLIENCIYGVDIQPIAVQIAKLRFFISLVVDQRVDPKKENIGIRPLPNLETKFVAANTLIGIEKPAQGSFRNPKIDELEEELRRVRQHHFSERTLRTKRKYREKDAELRGQISELLKKDGFPADVTKKLADWDPYNQNASADFFDPGRMFGMREGFDIILSNPPYVRQEELKEVKPELAKHFECYTGTSDLYVYFWEKGVKLLKQEGTISYISSNKFFRAGYGEKLRQFLTQNTLLRTLIDFGDRPVFEATTYPCVLVATRSRRGDGTANTVRARTIQTPEELDRFAEIVANDSRTMTQSDLTVDGWRIEDRSVLALLEKIKKAGVTLEEYVQGKIYYGIKTGYNEAFVIDEKTKERLIKEDKKSAEVIKPLLRGRDVKRYSIEYQNLHLIYIPNGWTNENRQKQESEKFFKAQLPSIYEHLKPHEKALEKRDDQGKHWWEMRPCAYLNEFAKKKIVWGNLGDVATFSLDSIPAFITAPACIIPTDDLLLLSILNSRLGDYFFHQIAAVRRGGYLEYKPMYVSQLPIATPSEKQRRAIEEQVEKILAAKKKDGKADTSALEKEIDVPVYKLYDLAYDEVKIIDPQFYMSKEQYERV